MNIQKMLADLTEGISISGFESPFNEYLKEILLNYTNDVTIDNLGNVIGVLHCGLPNARSVMLEAHFDQIGLMVSNVYDGGFLSFTSVGGVDERILPASEVYIGDKKIYGVIGHKPPHLGGSSKSARISDMVIDTGIENLKEQVNIGDKIALKSEFTRLLNNRVSSCAMDNRASIAALISVLESVRNIKLGFDLYIVFTAQEELGLCGAYAAAHKISPDAAIVVDVTHGQTPDTAKRVGTFPLSSGAIICRGPNLHFELTKRLISLAKANEIPYDIEVAAGNSGTSAWAVQTADKGVATMLISIPLRYMHTPVETLDISDIDDVSRLIIAYLKQKGGEQFA